jgi:hypothetical protein
MARKRNKQFFDKEESRYGLFMNDDSFNLDVMYGRHYIENDVVFRINLYRINIIESKAHDLYGQAKAKDKKYFPPVELHGIVDINDNEQVNYGSGEGGIVREDTGILTFGVYLEELNENKTEINRGDIIAWNQSGEKIRYYEVHKASNVTDQTTNTIAGMRPYYKLVEAFPVKEDVTQYLANDKLAKPPKKQS